MANKLYYVLGVDTQDFVVQDNGEAELWEQIEALQLQKYLIEKEKPKNKYKKFNGEKLLLMVMLSQSGFQPIKKN